MAEEISAKRPSEKRSEPRKPSKKFHSVEMKLASLPIYLFKLKNISPNGACFLIKEDSSMLKHLEVGQILDMRYHAEDEMEPSEIFRSEIKYIEKNFSGPFKGHYSIGIMLLEKQTRTSLQDEYD